MVDGLQRRNKNDIDELRNRPNQGDSGDMGDDDIRLLGSVANVVESNEETVTNLGDDEAQITETLNDNIRTFEIQANHLRQKAERTNNEGEKSK